MKVSGAGVVYQRGFFSVNLFFLTYIVNLIEGVSLWYYIILLILIPRG